MGGIIDATRQRGDLNSELFGARLALAGIRCAQSALKAINGRIGRGRNGVLGHALRTPGAT
eukprot:9737339-Alexandrium_andersonii.AAC.1